MKLLRRWGIPALLVLLLLSLITPAPAAAGGESATAVLLFTHDTHDHFLPTSGGGAETGGYTRLATLLKEQRALHPDAVTVDGGDFSMGSLFQTIYSTEAPELRALGAMGYDAATLGNHEFDYRSAGLAAMLNAAADSGEPLPALVQANYKPPAGDTAARAAWERYGIQDFCIITRGGVHYGIFGLMGEDGDACAPMSGMEFEPMAQAARRTVAALEAELAALDGPSLIVCLSHGGTENGKGEDYELARQVDGIDVILSGHTHTTLAEPIQVNDTLIVSCGAYTANLGVLELELTGSGTVAGFRYALLPVDGSVEEDPELAALTASFRPLVEETYLSHYGLTFDQVLAESPFPFTPIEQFGEALAEDPLGSLIADSYIYAVQEAEGDAYVPVDFAVVASGVVRDSFPAGAITEAGAFNVSSLGFGADGTPGYPLVSAWLTGRELRDLFEVDASVTPLMPAAQLYGSGMTWTFNPHRMIFNRVTSCAQVLPDGSAVPLEDGRLYRVVTGLYSAQMLGAVNEKSFGLLTVTPKDSAGVPITNYEDHILHTADGAEIKEWYALASYLASMGTVDRRYAAPEGRKISAPSWNPVELLKNPNKITVAVLLIGLAVLVLIVLLAIRLAARRKGRAYGSRRSPKNYYRRYRG